MLSIVPDTQIHLFQQCQLTFNGYLKQINSGSLTSILHILSSSWREIKMLQQLFPMRQLNLTCLYILTGLFMFFFFLFLIANPHFCGGLHPTGSPFTITWREYNKSIPTYTSHPVVLLHRFAQVSNWTTAEHHIINHLCFRCKDASLEFSKGRLKMIPLMHLLTTKQNNHRCRASTVCLWANQVSVTSWKWLHNSSTEHSAGNI